MSSSVNDETNNQKQEYAGPNTKIISTPINDIMFLTHNPEQTSINNRGFEKSMLNITDFPQKERLLYTITWTMGTPLGFIQEITPALYFANNAFAASNLYWHFDNEWHLRLNTNDFNQGFFNLCFDPAPTPTYYQDMFNKTLTAIDYFQFANVMIFAMDRTTTKFKLPNIYPFAYFVQMAYLQTYPMGRIRIFEIDPLITNSPTARIGMQLSLTQTDLIASGNMVRDVTITP